MYSRNRLSISISLQRDLALLFTELLSVISVDPHVVILIVMVVVIVLVNIVEHSAVRESDVSLRSWWRQKNGAKRVNIRLTFLRWTPVLLKVPITYTGV